MDLPNIESVFDFNFTSELGKKYEGRFTVLCLLDIGQKHRLALEKTRLLGNYPNPTADLAGYAEVLSNLRIKIIDAPDWWKQSQGGNLIKDEDAIVALYDKLLNAEIEWKAKLLQKGQAAAAEAAPQNSQS